jgi:DNA repair ATPase RecN
MSDESWDEQFRQFLRRKGEDFRRAAGDVRAEAQKLLDSAMDPQRQQKVRDRLNELSEWARKAASDVAVKVEEVASKAEGAFQQAAEKVSEAVTRAQRPSATPAPDADSASRTPSKPRKAGGTARKASAKRRRQKKGKS